MESIADQNQRRSMAMYLACAIVAVAPDDEFLQNEKDNHASQHRRHDHNRRGLFQPGG